MVIGVREVGWPPAAPAGLSGAADLSAASVAPVLLRQRLDLFGVLIDHVDSRAAVDRIRWLLASGDAHQIVTVNLDFLYLAERDAGFRRTINEADLAVPDGMPLVWLSRALGAPLKGRVTGVELVHESCRIAVEAVMDVRHVAEAVLHMASLPLEANVQFMTVMATKMPFVGRG